MAVADDVVGTPLLLDALVLLRAVLLVTLVLLRMELPVPVAVVTMVLLAALV